MSDFDPNTWPEGLPKHFGVGTITVQNDRGEILHEAKTTAMPRLWDSLLVDVHESRPFTSEEIDALAAEENARHAADRDRQREERRRYRIEEAKRLRSERRSRLRVYQLIARLQQMPPDAFVAACDFGKVSGVELDQNVVTLLTTGRH